MSESELTMTPSDPDISYRLASVADGELCNAFHNRVYGRRRSLASWQWEFASHRAMAGSLLPFVVAEADGQIVGTQAFLPLELVDRNGVFLSGKSEETLVDPGYRGRSIFERMYQRLFERAEEDGLECLWGFSPATKAFARIGFDTPGTVGQLLLPLRVDFLETAFDPELSYAKRMAIRFGTGVAWTANRILARVRRSADVELRRLDRAEGWMDEVSLLFADVWDVCTVHRSAEYVQWRFFDNPHAAAEVYSIRLDDEDCGIVVLAMAGGVLMLVDLVVVPPGIAREGENKPAARLIAGALDHVRKRAVELGASGVRGWYGGDDSFSRLVWSVAARRGWLRIRKGHSAVLWTAAGGSRRAPTDWSGWYVTRAFTEGHQG